MQDWAYLVGLILGTLALASVFWVWIRRQMFGTGGLVLSLVGFLLVGLSVWSNVRVSGGDWTLELQRLENRLTTVEDTNVVLAENLMGVADNVEINRNQFVQLTQTLESVSGINRAELDQIRGPVLEARPIDRERLEATIGHRITESEVSGSAPGTLGP